MGQTFQLEDRVGARPTDLPSEVPAVMPGRSENHQRLAAFDAEVVAIRNWLTRLDELDTAEIMSKLSSQHARLREIQAELWKMNAFQPAQQFRSRQVEPLLSDTMIHFQLHSRRLSSMDLDWQIARGQ